METIPLYGVKSPYPLPRENEDLMEYYQKLAAIVESASDAIIGTNLDGIITAWNQGAEKLYGITPQEAVGKNITIIVPGDRPNEVESIPEKIKQGESLEHYETVRVRKDGRQIHVSMTVSPIKDTNAQVVGVSSIARDITDEKHGEDLSRSMAEALEKRALELARSNEELEQFAHVASHDLQEPLRMVMSYVQLLEKRYKGKLDSDADEFIGYAVEGAKRMHHLINDLLTYSRVSRQEARFAVADSSKAAAEAFANLKQSLEETKAEVSLKDLPRVHMDPVELLQLFQNFLSNALKFRGEEPPKIRIQAERRDGWWLFSVKDNGIGIEAQYRKRIFVIFQRLHPRARYPGTGIGLAICKKIVESHCGKIWVESMPGKGSTFYFLLPAIPE